MSAAGWSAIIAGLALVLSAIGFVLGQVRQRKTTEQQNRGEAKIQAARERAELAEATANDARSRAAEAQEKIADLLARQGQVPERDLVMVRGKGSDEFELVNRGDKNYEGVTVFPQPDIEDLTKFPENIYVLAGDRSPGWRMRPKPGYQMPDHLMMWVANHGQIRIRIPPSPNP